MAPIHIKLLLEIKLFRFTVTQQEPLLNIHYKKVFVGKSPESIPTKHHSYDGNTILVQGVKGAYIYIGSGIHKFKPKDDKIVDYISLVGNNDVTYPYAIGEKNTYLILGPTVIEIPNTMIDHKNNNDAYDQYYQMPVSQSKKLKILRTQEIIPRDY